MIFKIKWSYIANYLREKDVKNAMINVATVIKTRLLLVCLN